MPQAQESCPDWRKIGSGACHRLRKAALTGGKLDLRHATGTACESANLSPPVFSPIEKRGKKHTNRFLGDLGPATGFLQRSAACHHRNNGGHRIKFLFV
jgi:hypothetical protein